MKKREIQEKPPVLKQEGANTLEKRTYAYARVSSSDQNLSRQLSAFEALGIPDERIISDKISGTRNDRIGYNYLKNNLLRRGDTLVIKSLDRLSRSKMDIKKELEYYKKAGIRVKILDIPTSAIDLPEGQEWVFEMVNNILIEVLSTIAQQERESIRQRQREGIVEARKNGTPFGRPRKEYDEKEFEELCGKWKNGEITAVEATKKLGISKSTFFRRMYEKKDGEIKEEGSKQMQ